MRFSKLSPYLLYFDKTKNPLSSFVHKRGERISLLWFKKVLFLPLTLILLQFLTASSQRESDKSSLSNRTKFRQPLAGTDELGRVLPTNQDVGDLKSNREVGIFYFLWQGDKKSPTSEINWDLSIISSQYPEALTEKNHPGWGSKKLGHYYFWGEPIWGYYRGDDYWVHLRNMQLLTDAGVDFLIIDATNQIIYPKQSKALMMAILSLQNQGAEPPRLVYYTNTGSGVTMQKIYDSYYREGAECYFPSSWYHLEGKPLIIGRTAEAIGREYESFFTFRESQWPTEHQQVNGWPWIDFNRPQSVYTNHNGEREIINVSVAQHPNPSAGMGGSAFYGNRDNWGRSYQNGSHGNPETDILYGYNFQEQWNYAIEQNLPFIFVTGWNEWIAGRWSNRHGAPEQAYFVDQADPEYSRDIEPTRTAGLGDNYYMQLVSNIRRYKGVGAALPAGPAKQIKSFADWDNVRAIYFDYLFDTQARNHPAAVTNPAKQYINKTGKNDFHIMKVARDRENIYFYAETAQDIIEHSSGSHMRLYLDVDRKQESGWYGYDWRIEGGKDLQCYIEGRWETHSQITVQLDGNRLYYTIPLSAIGLNYREIDIEFKWSDNMQDDSDPIDWYINGDVAPEGRFNFIYRTKR